MARLHRFNVQLVHLYLVSTLDVLGTPNESAVFLGNLKLCRMTASRYQSPRPKTSGFETKLCRSATIISSQ
ncbi:hypothetical protein DFH29DRAFT_961005 [Suillus ampliporus]|nr:hypothetical protein DFH29DRAFT_961005 [Suillus ampliporus]